MPPTPIPAATTAALANKTLRFPMRILLHRAAPIAAATGRVAVVDTCGQPIGIARPAEFTSPPPRGQDGPGIRQEEG